jgi:predicted phosphoribosyltransferase
VSPTGIPYLPYPTDQATPILVAATSSPGTAIFMPSRRDAGRRLILKACNLHTASVVLTIEWGGTTTAYQVKHTLPSQSGEVLVLDRPVAEGFDVAAFASVTNVVNVHREVV